MSTRNTESSNEFLQWMLEHKGNVNHPIALSVLMREFFKKKPAGKNAETNMVDVQVMRKRIKRIFEKPVETYSHTYTMNQIIQLHFLIAIPVSEQLRQEIEKHGKLQLGATRKAIQAYHSYDGTFIRTGKGWEDTQSSSNSTLVDTSTSDAQAVKEERRMAHVPQDQRSQNLGRYPYMGNQSRQNGALQRRDPLQPGSVQWDMHIPKEEPPNSAETNQMVYHNGADSPFQGTAPIQPGNRSPSLEMHIPKDEFGNAVGSSPLIHHNQTNGSLQGSAYGGDLFETAQMPQQSAPNGFVQTGVPHGFLASLDLLKHLHNMIVVLKNASFNSVDHQIVVERDNLDRQHCVVSTEDFMTSVKQCLGVLRRGAHTYHQSTRQAMPYELFLNLFKFFLLTVGAPVTDPTVLELDVEFEKCKNAPSMVVIEVSKIECVLTSLFHMATPFI
ncbi:unnamed protein product [Caenorhabditis brenneri]